MTSAATSGWNRRTALASGAAWALIGPELAKAQPRNPVEDAYLAAFPLFEMARLAAQSRGGINRLNHRRTLSSHADRAVTLPNNDTLYSSAWFDLSGGAIDIDLPLDHPGYYSATVMSAFTDVVAIMGSGAGRANERLTAPLIRLVGPEWRGAAPAGRRIVRCPTVDGWFLSRTGVAGPADLADAQRVQDAIRFETNAASQASARQHRASAAADAATFLAVVNETLRRTDRAFPPARAMRRFAALGVDPHAPAWAALSAETQDAWTRAVQSSLAIIGDLSRHSATLNGWSWPDRVAGHFGNDFAYRAAVALGGIGALPESEAMYLTAIADSRGRPLTPGGRYRWTIPSGVVPVDGFWSLTAYQAEPDGRFFLYDNPLGRYAIGDRTPDLVHTAEGHLCIAIQASAPAAGNVNWLPFPEGPSRLVLRAYQPQRAFVERRWRPPALERVV
jgi:hypothetical protein